MSADPEPGIFSHGRACAWPRRFWQGPVRMLTPEEVRTWILYEDERLLVINKPGDVVCHPSKSGPWSSLVGAAREVTGLPTVHLVFRLDRETSGIVLMAKDPRMASRLQRAAERHAVSKSYLAVLSGELEGPISVDQPLGDDTASPVFVKSAVRPDGKRSLTHFMPLATAGGFTLARVKTETGRKHQIRAHAQWMGKSIVGDKIYGPYPMAYLEFIDGGWTESLASRLLMRRQALHCAELDLRVAELPLFLKAPLPEDMRQFCEAHGLRWENRTEDPPAPLSAGPG